MKSLLELLGRFVIATTNMILLMWGEPHIAKAVPILGPYSIHLMYTGIVLLGLWMLVPLINIIYGYSHTHD